MKTTVLFLALGMSAVAQDPWVVYPGTGKHSEVGRGEGSGSNLNIAFGRGRMGNTHYAAAFSEAVLPILSSYNPDLILVGCGFDAAEGDLLGVARYVGCQTDDVTT